MNYEEMKIKLQSRLKPSRYEHSVGVAETAVFLAERFHVDVEKARIAGLLHDCARQYSNEQLPQEASGRGIAIGPVEKEMPLLLHGYVGAKLIVSTQNIRNVFHRVENLESGTMYYVAVISIERNQVFGYSETSFTTLDVLPYEEEVSESTL